jgi:hypothetical protein
MNKDIVDHAQRIAALLARAETKRKAADHYNANSVPRQSLEQEASDIDGDIRAACEALRFDIKQGLVWRLWQPLPFRSAGQVGLSYFAQIDAAAIRRSIGWLMSL